MKLSLVTVFLSAYATEKGKTECVETSMSMELVSQRWRETDMTEQAVDGRPPVLSVTWKRSSTIENGVATK